MAPTRYQGGLPSGDHHSRLGLKGITSGRDVEGAILNADISPGGILLVFRLQAVASGFHRNLAALSDDIVLAPDVIVHRADGDRAAGNHKPIFAGDAVLIVAIHLERAVAGDGRVSHGKDGAGGSWSLVPLDAHQRSVPHLLLK